jgi:hypothetical protein
MTIRDLDRLVSKTEMTPASKTALKAVRRAVMSGRCGNAEVGTGNWSITLDTDAGYGVKMNFSFKRD